MKYTLQDIYKALAAAEDGAQMVSDIQEEIGNLRKEAGNHRTAKNKILEVLGIKDTDNIENAVTGLQTLTQQVNDLTAKYNESQQQTAAERTKRLEESKVRQVVAVLESNHATSPSELAQLVLSKIQINEDESFTYKDGDKELSVEEGVKGWIWARPCFMKNMSRPGAGTHAPQDWDGDPIRTAMELPRKGQ